MMGLYMLLWFTLCSVLFADGDADCPDVENKEEVTFTFNSKCYQYIENVDEKITYLSAEQDCTYRGGHLVTINDNATQTELVNQLQYLSDSHTVITGLRKLGNEWKWITGERLSFTNWDSDAYCNGTCDCAILKLSSEGRWQRYGCEQSDWFTAHVCEYGSMGCRLNPGHLHSVLFFAMARIVTQLCGATLS